MPRTLLGIAALLVAVLASGCAIAIGDGGVSAEGIEGELAKDRYGATDIDCEQMDEGWDYVCQYTDVEGRRLQVGLLLDGRDLDRSSAPISATAALASPREAVGEHGGWLEGVNALCRSVVVELQAVPAATNDAEFSRYAARVRSIGRRYIEQLEALPPPPGEADRPRFSELLDLLREDETAIAELEDAVRQGDDAGVGAVFAVMGRRNLRENELLNVLGGDCAPAAG